jgi:hypothetical protein
VLPFLELGLIIRSSEEKSRIGLVFLSTGGIDRWWVYWLLWFACLVSSLNYSYSKKKKEISECF